MLDGARGDLSPERLAELLAYLARQRVPQDLIDYAVDVAEGRRNL